MTKKTKSEKIWAYKLKHRKATISEIAKATGTSTSYVWKLTQKIGTPKKLVEAEPAPFKPAVLDMAYEMTKHGVNTAGVDPNAWTRTGILNQAEQYVTKDRAADHGDMEDNFQRISDLWTAYLGFDLIITSKDVAVMMTLLKIARIKSNPQNSDNWIDGAGYLACGGEIATQQKHK
jgi:hypothetical protein